MKIQHISSLSILFLITACSSGASAVVVEQTASDTPVSASAAIKTVEPIVETKNEIVLLDFAISPDGKKLAVYLNTGVYLYDIETLKRTAFYEFESDEYYSELNAGTTIYHPLGAPGALAFSPDGSEIVISGKFQDEYITIWDLSTHEIVDYIANYPNGNFVRELEYHPKGDTLLIRSTYPEAKLQCPEQGAPPEDTLTLVSLNSRRNLIEKKGCYRWAVTEFYFSENNEMYFFHFGDTGTYSMYKVDTQTGKTISDSEIASRLDGRIYDISPNGRVFAALDTSNSTNGVLRTILIDTTTRRKLLSLNGKIDFLDNEDRFLVNTSEIHTQSQLQLQENGKTTCVFNKIEYYQPYTRISKNSETIASLTFENRIFQNSIQIWDIPSCKLIKTIPID